MIPSTATDRWGVIPSVFNQSDLIQYRDTFRRCKPEATDEYIGEMHGINPNSVAFPWFMAKMWPRLVEHFENKSIQLIHSMYASFTKPFMIHDDAYKAIPNGDVGRNYVSMLIPVSVENKPIQADVSTIIMREQANPHAEHDHKVYFSHCDINQVRKYTIDGVCTWREGDIIWWDSRKPHSSSNFNSRYRTKECFVVHTYV